jgi:predicted transcriptional regulator
MKIHIGNHIQKKCTELKLGTTEFAKKINTTKQNVYAIFKRESIDTELLYKISKELRYDFFKLYNDQLNIDELASLSPEQKIIIQDKEIAYLKQLVEILKIKQNVV